MTKKRKRGRPQVRVTPDPIPDTPKAIALALSWPVFDAQITVESNWTVNAVSSAGAEGIAQIIPRWHPDAKGHTFDPEWSLRYAATWMRELVKARGGNYEQALIDYNVGVYASAIDRECAAIHYADKILTAVHESPYGKPVG